MHEELSVLKLVTSRLERAGLPYMVTGSLALSLYAEPRMRRDVDLVVDLTPADLTRFITLFEADFQLDHDRVRDAIAERSMVNLIHTPGVVKVDVIISPGGRLSRQRISPTPSGTH
jgi:hypothetical protein